MKRRYNILRCILIALICIPIIFTAFDSRLPVISFSEESSENSEITDDTPHDLQEIPAPEILHDIQTADKIPVAQIGEILSDSQYVIYKKIWNADTSRYDNYAIDGYGNLCKVWESGSVIQWYADISDSLYWEIIKYNDIYYDFFNPVTGNYISPQNDSCISDEKTGVTLSGINDNTYSSAIEAWDNSTWNWYGLSYIGNDTNSSGENILTDNAVPVLASGIKSNSKNDNKSEKFIFAKMHTAENFTPVETVDHESKGITVKLFNYNSNVQSRIMGNDQWTGEGGGRNQALVRNTLNQNGFPTASKTGKSLEPLFSESSMVNQYYTVNGLFLKSTYDETGYFEYSCFENSAAIEQDNIPYGGNTCFSVYQELTTPENNPSVPYNRGNFLPFNRADENDPAAYNIYNENGSIKDDDDPRKNEKIYIQNSADYYFGMSIDTDFMIPKNGCDENGNPVIFEFNGDDDFWLFIDNVLVMDIGGIHDALNGSINFSSGEIKISDGTNKNTFTVSTLYEQFADAGIISSEYFTDDGLFKDYSTHNMKIFYMERGAGASNLKLRFNLAAIDDNSIFLHKECTGTQTTDTRYAYQLYYREKNSDDFILYDNPVEPPVFEGTSVEIPHESSAEIAGMTYDSVYCIKAGETAEFKLPQPDMEYYFSEIGLYTPAYKAVDVNGDTLYDRENNISANIIYHDENSEYIDINSYADNMTERRKVIYTNHPDPEYLRNIKITKKLVYKDENNEYHDVCNDDSLFEFQVEFMDENGSFIPYNKGDYYLTDSDDNYYVYNNGILTQSDTPAVCSTSGANGSIAGIPCGFTVIIKDVAPHTVFRIYEQENKIPQGYNTLEYVCGQENDEDSYFFEDDACIGTVRENYDSHIIVVNEKLFTLNIEKIWDKDSDFIHDSIYVALFNTDGIYVENSLRELSAGNYSCSYYLDENTYAAKEIKLDSYGNPVIQDGCPVPLSENDSVSVRAKSVEEEDFSLHNYTVSYNQVLSPENNSRTDIIINSVCHEDTPEYGNIKIIKNINRRNPDTGACVFMFRAVLLDNSENSEYVRYISFEGNSTCGFAEIKNIPSGRYKIEELPCLGYEISSVSSDCKDPEFHGKSTAFVTVSANSTVTVTYENNLTDTDKKIYKSFADNYINYKK